MTVCQTFNDLFKKRFCHVLLKSSPTTHIIKKITSRAHLNDEKDVLLGLEVFEKSHDIRVLGLLQHHDFLHHLLHLARVTEELLVDRLDGTQLLGELVNCQVDFSKRTFAQDFTDSVEVNGGVWRLSDRGLFERDVDQLDELSDLF